jgi:hypothetical protein
MLTASVNQSWNKVNPNLSLISKEYIKNCQNIRWIYKRYEDIWKYMFMFVGKLLMEEISYGAKLESVGLLRRALDIKTTNLGNNYMYMWCHQESLLHLFSGCNLYCNLYNNWNFRVWTHTTWVHSFTKALICISHWYFQISSYLLYIHLFLSLRILVHLIFTVTAKIKQLQLLPNEQ